MQLLDLTVIIDTVSITGKLTKFHQYTDEPRAVAQELLRQLLPFEVETTTAGQFFEIGQERGRINFFQHSYAVHFDGDLVGHISHGGNEDATGRGAWQLYLGASGCAVIGLSNNWRHVKQAIINLDARLSRIDLAVDDLDGKFSLDDYMTFYRDGLFDPETGRHPKCSLTGNPFEQTDDGRTFYVGKRGGIKMARIYEKGKQLGYGGSAWVRFEVEYKRDKDAELHLDMLTRPGDYFRGSYQVTALIVKNAASYRETLRQATKIKLEVALQHARRSYGKWIQTAQALGYEVIDIVTEGIDHQPPRRLLSEAVQAGIPPVVIRGETSPELDA